MPDFAYSGQGVRISAASPGGAAAAAGLQANDVLLTYDGEQLNDLQNYSNKIRESAPGDTVILEVLRDGQTFSVDVTLKAR